MGGMQPPCRLWARLTYIPDASTLSHISCSQALLNCDVVDTIASLVSLCRDETIQEYSYAVSVDREELPFVAAESIETEPDEVAKQVSIQRRTIERALKWTLSFKISFLETAASDGSEIEIADDFNH